VIKAEEEILETNNGCICCTVRGDLIRILCSLMKRRDRIVGETTGMAAPSPAAQAFFVDDYMREQVASAEVIVPDGCTTLGLPWQAIPLEPPGAHRDNDAPRFGRLELLRLDCSEPVDRLDDAGLEFVEALLLVGETTRLDAGKARGAAGR
jgi:hypothetical protein